MKYKVQEHEVREKVYMVYQCAPNGEVCKHVATCQTKENANLLVELLEDKDKESL